MITQLKNGAKTFYGEKSKFLKTCNPQFDMLRKPGEIHRESAMSDFTLSITKHPSGLTITATGGKQVTLELPWLSGLVGQTHF
jgi:hypothetical protein